MYLNIKRSKSTGLRVIVFSNQFLNHLGTSTICLHGSGDTLYFTRPTIDTKKDYVIRTDNSVGLPEKFTVKNGPYEIVEEGGRFNIYFDPE